MQREAEQIVPCTLFHDPAAIEDRYAVSYLKGDVQGMGNEQYGQLSLPG